MKKNFWKKPYGAIALIMALVLVAVNPSLAYFTDYTTAAGTAPVAAGAFPYGDHRDLKRIG